MSDTATRLWPGDWVVLMDREDQLRFMGNQDGQGVADEIVNKYSFAPWESRAAASKKFAELVRCRRCVDCEHSIHHWLEGYCPDNANIAYRCKHCPATATICDACGGDGAEPYNEPLYDDDEPCPCGVCGGSGALLLQGIYR